VRGAAPERWTLLLHPVLLLAGAGCGLLTRWRAREIDANRWRVLSDPLLTRGEKEWAHHDAEAERRRAAVVFLLCPLVLGMWLAYDLGEEGPLGFLPVTGLVGFGIGLLAGTLLDRTERRGA
jgi:hypothetical protein